MSANDDRLAKRRREILAAAQNIFDAHGYALTTMEAVAAEAGISKGSVYNYFENKHALFVQVFSQAIAGGEAATDLLLRQPLSAGRKLDGLLDDWFARLGHYKRIGALVLEFWATAARQQRDGDMASWFGQMYSRWREQITRIISQGVEAGEFRNDVDASVAAALILAVIDGITVQSIMDINLGLDSGFLAALKRSILAALTVEAAPDRPGA